MALVTAIAPKFSRESPEIRRTALIEATLRILSRCGPQGATVRAIAAEAEVTQGLIRHHFETKDELLCAAFDYHMTSLTARAAASLGPAGPNPLDRLRAFVITSLTSPVVDGHAVFLWAGFVNMAQTNTRMRAVHAKTYLALRDLLEELISDVFAARKCPVSERQLRSKTIACNAILDGLWLEGGALPEEFDPDHLLEAGLGAIEDILDVSLGSTATGRSTGKETS